MEDWGGFIDQFVGEMRGVFREHNKGAESVKASLLAFVHAVDWTEPWIIGLLCSHVVVFISIVLTRNHSNAQACLFVWLVSMVYMAETLNAALGANWQLFSRQNYFDANGFFVSMVYSCPNILLSLMVLANQVYQMAQLMIKVKRAQFRAEAASRGRKSDSTDNKKRR